MIIYIHFSRAHISQSLVARLGKRWSWFTRLKNSFVAVFIINTIFSTGNVLLTTVLHFMHVLDRFFWTWLHRACNCLAKVWRLTYVVSYFDLYVLKIYGPIPAVVRLVLRSSSSWSIGLEFGWWFVYYGLVDHLPRLLSRCQRNRRFHRCILVLNWARLKQMVDLHINIFVWAAFFWVFWLIRDYWGAFCYTFCLTLIRFFWIFTIKFLFFFMLKCLMLFFKWIFNLGQIKFWNHVAITFIL